MFENRRRQRLKGRPRRFRGLITRLSDREYFEVKRAAWLRGPDFSMEQLTREALGVICREPEKFDRGAGI